MRIHYFIFFYLSFGSVFFYFFYFFFYLTSGFLVLLSFVSRCFRSIKDPKVLGVEIWEPNYLQERQSNIWEPNSTFGFVQMKPPFIVTNQPTIFCLP